MRLPVRRRHLRLRLLPLYGAALALVAWAEPGAIGLLLGGVLVLAGLGLRAWAAGHLVKTRALARSGPYAHIRHPLYAGALLMGVGFALAAGGVGAWLAIGVGLPFFLLYYLPYKERIESARLERRHGADYADYRARVPALWPACRWRPGPGSGRRWSGSRFRANHEIQILAGGLAALGGLAWLAL